LSISGRENSSEEKRKWDSQPLLNGKLIISPKKNTSEEVLEKIHTLFNRSLALEPAREVSALTLKTKKNNIAAYGIQQHR
jgi:hypothetical protein